LLIKFSLKKICMILYYKCSYVLLSNLVSINYPLLNLVSINHPLLNLVSI
jgi:hypothetical protein